MPVAPEIVTDNNHQRQNLATVVSRLGDEDKDLGGGWTVGATLAHLAFWDRYSLLALSQWESRGTPPASYDADIFNDALLEGWRAIPLQHAGALALAAAKDVDVVIETLSSKTVEAAFESDMDWLIRRGEHRSAHLGEIT
ncbi:MAG: hypothetical protein O2854_08135 [Chloroflexi bacterium]|nr:hypothetical protein [Chloroflexota bacterium]